MTTNFFLNDIGDPSKPQASRKRDQFLTDIKQITAIYVGRIFILSSFKVAPGLGDFSSWDGRKRTNISASASIMRRLVEDVTGKKIEHLIKKSLSGRDFPSSECAISSVLAEAA